MKIEISIIIPAFNEEKNVENIYLKFYKIFKNNLTVPHEIIFVNNASTDKTLSKIKKISKSDKSVKYISLTRNFGYQSSLKAGLDNSIGKYTMMIDSDCEDPPDLLVDFYKIIKEKNFNLVY